jgi:hypothetical protein
LRARATALARAKWPIPTPLLVARMIVGLDMALAYRVIFDENCLQLMAF